jgi:deoxyribonuclease-4
MRFGAQVRQTGGFVAALGRAEEMGAEVVQLFAQSNRQWRLPADDDEPYAAYRAAATRSAIVRDTVCHAPYLINVISPDAETRDRSMVSLVANLAASSALGALGLVLHPGSHRGVDAATAVRRIGACLVTALDEAEDRTGRPARLLLENTAGSGGTVGRSIGELGALIDATGGDGRVGVCIDTQHLWASGCSYATPARAEALVRRLAEAVGLDRLGCLHLNDSKVPLGANSDRHANLGQGTIGRRALGALLAEPELQNLPAVLEVPGIAGRGPGREDLDVARSLHAAGLAARRRRLARATRASGSGHR